MEISKDNKLKLINQIKDLSVYKANKKSAEDWDDEDYLSWLLFKHEDITFLFEWSHVLGQSEREFYIVDKDFNFKLATEEEDELLREVDNNMPYMDKQEELFIYGISNEKGVILEDDGTLKTFTAEIDVKKTVTVYAESLVDVIDRIEAGAYSINEAGVEDKITVNVQSIKELKE